jgi:exportin-2 (importin alpha re-exporter)
MELTDDNLRTLSDYLQHTLSPDVNVRRPGEFNLLKQTVLVSVCLLYVSSQVFYMIIEFFFCSAEKFLESVEVNQNYPVLLLHLVD